MEKKDIIKGSIRDFQEKLPVRLIKREIELPINLNKIITVYGWMGKICRKDL